MRKLLVILAVCLNPVAAFADCTHLDFSEIKSMSTTMLRLEYCKDSFAAKRADIDANGEKQEAALLRQRGDNASPVDIMRSDRQIEKSESIIQQCTGEMDRIFPVLGKRKIDLKKLMQDCPSP